MARQSVRDYCRRWYEEFGYQMYSTVVEILEEVWIVRDVGGEEVWWGNVIDRRQDGDGNLNFCFG